ncbi:sulfate permease [Mycobacterium sp. NPDC050551]|uniref:SulP family inorganic anion transporter n=1 Tax=Mycobacterium sp. NPDC050551 TaxID=3155407 RepID=UPI00343ED61A
MPGRLRNLNLARTIAWAPWLPGLAHLRAYRRSDLRGDVQAGLSVSAYLIPQSLAYATLAGLNPVVGLWAALPPLAVYAVMGSSRQLSVGPESTTALMTAVVLLPVAGAGDPARYAGCAAALAILVGVICLIAGFLRLGYLANLLSKPVLVGYLCGIALAMVAGQLGRLSGTPLFGDAVVEQVREFFGSAAHWHWPTVILSIAVLASVSALGRWAPRLPGPLIGVAAASVAVGLLSLSRHGIDLVGMVPGGLPAPGLPAVSALDLRALLVPAVGIAVVAFSDNVLTARAFASRTGDDIDANAELRALGSSNLAVSLMHGFPVSSSGSRTALGVASGAKTQMYSLVVLAVVIVAVLVGTGALATIPAAALGALVVYAAVKLVDVGEFRRLARFRRSECILALATALSVVLLGVLQGVLVAVALTILDLLRRLAHAHDSVLGIVPGVAGMHDVDDYPEATLIPGLLVYRYDAPLCFANAEDFRRRALDAIDRSASPVRWFVLNVEANVEIDMTAIDALEQLRSECERRGIVFALARLKQDLRDPLDAAGMIDAVGTDKLFMTLPTAVAAYRRAQESGDRGSPPA